MDIYTIKNLTFTYGGRKTPALSDINISFERGSFTVLCGKSGSGKTTLLRLLKSATAPSGEISGELLFEGESLTKTDVHRQAAEIGFVGQNPENQTVCDKVWHELAFGLESLGFPTSEIRARVAEMSAFFGIEPWFRKKVSELSGGQVQLLNLAAVMVMRPSVLILDEPTAFLDPIASVEFLETVKRINSELGVTVIISEHNADAVIPMADRIAVLSGGRLEAFGRPVDVIPKLPGDLMNLMPAPARACIASGGEGCPITVREGRAWLSDAVKSRGAKPVESDKSQALGGVMAELKNVWFRYEKNSADVLRGVNLSVRSGEIYALLGGNGAGKTTAASVLGGLLNPIRGSVFIDGKKLSEIPRAKLYRNLLGVMPQNPQTLFVGETLREDIDDMLAELKVPRDEREESARSVLELCELSELENSHPYDLSGGEQQRAALAKILLTKPRILILDEPTKGMDNCFKRTFGEILNRLKADGACVIMVSHDTEFCAEYADRAGLFFDGEIVSEDEPKKFFSQNSYYTTAAAKMARGIIDGAVTCGDIAKALGASEKEKRPPRPPKQKSDSENKKTADGGKNTDKNIKKSENVSMITRRGFKGHNLLVLLLAAIIVPLTVLAGVYLLNDRKFYFISLAVIAEAFAAFAFAFEGRRPRERELVTAAVFCALAVAGRGAFFMLPQFKATAAVVIIAGICFGGETGFLVGAVAMFISNMFIGQGSWVPWQMFAMGLVGGLAGLLFHSGILPRRRGVICAFGALSVLVVYGGIINPSSVLLVTPYPQASALLSSYVYGFPFDLIHAASTAVFLWLIAKPIMEKFDRIKVKYEIF